MSSIFYYYLHTNGELILKVLPPEPGDFVRRIWTVNLQERESAYIMLVEAACLGAGMSRILDLAKKWGMDGDDGLTFCERMGFECRPHESEAGKGFLLAHKEDEPTRSRGEGSSPLLALISYTRASDAFAGAST